MVNAETTQESGEMLSGFVLLPSFLSLPTSAYPHFSPLVTKHTSILEGKITKLVTQSLEII